MSDTEALQAKITALESEISGLKGALSAERTKRQSAEQTVSDANSKAAAADAEAKGLAAQMKSFATEREGFEAYKAQATKQEQAWSREKAVIQAGFPIDKAEQVLTIAQSLHTEGDFTEFLAAQKAEPWAQGYLASNAPPAPAAPAAPEGASAGTPESVGAATGQPAAPVVPAPKAAAFAVNAPSTAAGTLPAGGPGGQTSLPGSILAAAASDPAAFLRQAMGPGYKMGRLSNGEG